MGLLKKIAAPVQHMLGNVADAVGIGGALRSFDDHITQPIVNTAADTTKTIVNTANDAFTGLANLAYDASIGGWEIPGSHVLGNAILTAAPGTYDSWSKPAGAFVNKFDQAAEILPEQVEPYAPQIASTVLSFFGTPLAGAAFNTAYNAGQQQNSGQKFDWNALGKDAAVNFGTAALSMGLDSLAQGAQAGNQATANANAMKAASPFNSAPTMSQGAANMGYTTAADVGTSLGRSYQALASSTPTFVSQVPGALTSVAPDVFNAAKFMSTTTPKNYNAPASDSSSSLPSAKTQSVFNAATNTGKEIVSNLGQTALTNALGTGTAITGATSEGPMAAESGLANPAGINADALGRWYSGDGTYDEAGLIKGYNAINQARLQQIADARDMSRMNGRWALTAGTDTPYAQQESDIENNMQNEIKQFSTEYQAAADLQALQNANPQFYDSTHDTNYWLNEAKSGYAPKSVMDAFGNYTKYAKPIDNFQSAYAPASLTPTAVSSFQAKPML